MKNKLKSLIIMSFAGMLIFAGCSNGTQGNKVLKVAIEKTFNTLNHQTSDTAAESEVINQFMEGLFRFDDKQNFTPAGAESYEVSDDGLVYTFNLRQSAKWKNGDPVTAQDYVFAWKTAIVNQKTAGKKNMMDIKNASSVSNGEAAPETLGLKAVDDYTFEVTLEAPNAAFVQKLVYSKFLPVHQVTYEAAGGEEGYGMGVDSLMTNGAFDITEYVVGSKIVLVKNATYWDAKTVSLDGVEINVIPELTTQNVMFDQGELDMLRVQGELSDIYENDTSLVSGLESRMLYMYLSNDISGNGDVLKNKNLRAAIAHSIDKSLITENIVKGGAVPLNGLFLEDFYKVDGIDYRAQSGQFQEEIFDATKAQTFLQKAKQELGKEEITFTFMVQDMVIYKKTFENIKSQVEANLPGVKMEIATLPNQVYFKEVMKKETSAGMGTWSADYTDLYNFAQLLEFDNSFNLSAYNNPEYQALVDAAKAETNIKKQADIYAQAEKLMMDDYVFIPIYQQGMQYKVKDGIKGITYNPVVPIIDFKYVSKN